MTTSSSRSASASWSAASRRSCAGPTGSWPTPRPGDTLRRGDLVIDLERRRVTRGGERIGLTTTEFDLLRHLAARPGRVYTRSQLLELVRDYDDALEQDERTINVHISHIRDKIEPDPAAAALHPDGEGRRAMPSPRTEPTAPSPAWPLRPSWPRRAARLNVRLVVALGHHRPRRAARLRRGHQPDPARATSRSRPAGADRPPRRTIRPAAASARISQLDDSVEPSTIAEERATRSSSRRVAATSAEVLHRHGQRRDRRPAAGGRRSPSPQDVGGARGAGPSPRPGRGSTRSRSSCRVRTPPTAGRRATRVTVARAVHDARSDPDPDPRRTGRRRPAGAARVRSSSASSPRRR